MNQGRRSTSLHFSKFLKKCHILWTNSKSKCLNNLVLGVSGMKGELVWIFLLIEHCPSLKQTLDQNWNNKSCKISETSIEFDTSCTRYAGQCYPAFRWGNKVNLKRLSHSGFVEGLLCLRCSLVSEMNYCPLPQKCLLSPTATGCVWLQPSYT